MKKLNNKAFAHLELIFILLVLVVIGLTFTDVVGGKKKAYAVQTTIPSSGFVHQSGTTLLDGNNSPITLRGVNLGGYLNWEGWIWGTGFEDIGQTAIMNNLNSLVGQSAATQFQASVYNDYMTSADFQNISSNGLNVVRLGFNAKLLENPSNPGVYLSSGWAVLDNLITEAQQNNVYVVLDMHAAPCGQSTGFTSDYTGGSTLWQSASCQTDAINLWQAIAQRYANNNDIAGYDLLNEPITSNANLLSMYKRLTTAIRQVDNNHLLIYEGTNFSHDFSLFTTPLDKNEMFSPHDYPLSGPNLTTINSFATKINAPLWIGEFGQASTTAVGKQIQQFKTYPNIAGWADWTYKENSGWPAMQDIKESADAKLFIDYITDTNSTKPTAAQATQGMSDFLNEIQIQNTTPNATMDQTLAQ